jgi:membrane protease YdiL (CAAX protease family)
LRRKANVFKKAAVLKILFAYFALAFIIFLSAYLFPPSGWLGTAVPAAVSILLLVPIYAWYRNYRQGAQLQKEVPANSESRVLLSVFALFLLALSVRIPSALFFGLPFEKTPLILLTVSTILLVEKTEVSAFGFTTRRLGKSLAYGLAFFSLLNALTLVVNGVLVYAFTDQILYPSFNISPFILSLPFMTLCVGISEEGLFRGYMQTHLEKIFKPTNAIVVQAVLFGVWHFVWNLSPFDPFGMAQYVSITFFMGLLFGYFYSKTRSLLPLVFAHGLWDSVAQGIVENQTALNALDTGAPLGRLLTFFLPYAVPFALTFLYVKFTVKKIGDYQTAP